LTDAKNIIDGDKLSHVENESLDMMLDVTGKYMQTMSVVNSKPGQLPPRGKK
jgi:hypothetical protein